MGTEEDGVDEAGRATEPSLMVAPSGRDIDPDEETVEATADNEVMTGADEGELEDFAGSASDDADADTPDEADQSANGHAGAASHPSVPLPADEIGRSKGSSADSAVSADPADAEDSPKDDGDQPDGSHLDERKARQRPAGGPAGDGRDQQLVHLPVGVGQERPGSRARRRG